MAKSGKTKSNITAGLRDKMPKATDKSSRPPSASVNSDTTRSSTAKHPRSIGPRTA